jgi:uncharacterized protein YecT (DUF1311 family)
LFAKKRRRMRFYFAIVLFLFSVVPAIAAGDDEAVKCNPAGNQMELNACAGEEFEKADAELNKVYNSLLQKEKKDVLFIKKLRESQKAWVRFRDAELDATFACVDSVRECWGSMYPMCYHFYKAKITRDRTTRLKKYLTEGRPADDCH